MRTSIGAMAWGLTTIVLALASLAIVVLGGVYIDVSSGSDLCCAFDDPPPWLPGAYIALKDHGSLVAGVLGFSGLAWAHFYQAMSHAQPTSIEPQPARPA